MSIENNHKPHRTFLDRFLDIPEPKVSYLTKVTWVDRLMSKTFLKLLPSSVTPNRITQFRLICIPFVAWALLAHDFSIAMPLFVIAAFSDALDGALARTERKITSWGTLYDPVADKLLVGITSLIIVSEYISIRLALAIVFIELCLVASAYFRYKGRIVPAKTMGKIKMLLQCFGISFLLLYLVIGSPILLTIATYLLYLALMFGLLSLFVFRSI
ncbi:MAG TPA: CDP-alcohol phosphatidyltransferase family protein [Candidatus Paceibacterota bacterium]|nr:CDP-alcohol phosphatidyltransferase family protein [Candidatus Paceibacterota bacterium]